MFQPLFLTHENFLLHPFRADDLARYDQLVEQILGILQMRKHCVSSRKKDCYPLQTLSDG
jgi:hypothetical protein